MAWGTASSFAAVTLTSSWQDIGTITTSNATDIVDLQLVGSFQSSPSNNINYQLLASTDNTTFDGIPIAGAKIQNSNATPVESIAVTGYRYIKVQGQIDGTTDTTDSLAANYIVG